MKKIYCILFFLITTVSSVANPVTSERARSHAIAFLKAHGAAGLAASMEQTGRAVLKTSGSNAPYYIYNVGDAEGFVVVAGDDRVPAILGYADSGTLDMDNLPVNVAAFLDSYAAQIKSLGNKSEAKKTAAATEQKTAVAPLLATYWGQRAPFNNNLPEITYNGSTYNLYVGCVGVAAAQVMGYYRYPDTVRATIPAYQTPSAVAGQTITLPAVEAGTPIDWNNIQNIYRGAETKAQTAAVADFMKISATAVRTQFSTTGSGAYTCDVPYAMRTYFGYSNSARLVYRRDYSQQQWTDLLYGELAAGRPVIIGAQGTPGGHEFIADGYDGEGLFHINWGWTGQCNGYFRLSMLDPGNNYDPDMGITGSGYNESMEAVIGLSPAAAEETEALMKMDGTISEYSAESKTVKCLFYNMTGVAGSFDFGIGYINRSGRIVVLNSKSNQSYERNYGSYYTGDVSGLAVGTYKIRPVSRLHGQKTWIADSSFVNCVIDKNHNVKFSISSVRLKAKDFNFYGTKTAGVEQPFTVTITNNGDEYYGNLYLFANNISYGYADIAGVGIPAGDSAKVKFSFLPYVKRQFHMYVATDEKGTNVIGDAYVDIADSAAAVRQLSAASCKLENGQPTGTSGICNVKGNWLRGTFSVRNNAQMPFTGNLTVYMYCATSPEETFRGSGEYIEPVLIESGGTQEINFKFYAETGLYYVAMLQYDDGESISRSEIACMLGGTTDGIGTPLTDSFMSLSSKVYTLSGVAAGTVSTFSSLPRGLYIVEGRKVVKR